MYGLAQEVRLRRQGRRLPQLQPAIAGRCQDHPVAGGEQAEPLETPLTPAAQAAQGVQLARSRIRSSSPWSNKHTASVRADTKGADLPGASRLAPNEPRSRGSNPPDLERAVVPGRGKMTVGQKLKPAPRPPVSQPLTLAVATHPGDSSPARHVP